ncbi:hypothetical protein O3M35_005514 [Rhynocoris fuscipes]|uniref:Uncharacterized protein n=1 Tax=Rhynocoris fuscipes TaxID=488301 RepID=A0AAW1DPD5_9HEMI
MTELERKMCFVFQVKWHVCLFNVAQKQIKPKLSNIRMEFKKFLAAFSRSLDMVDTKFATLSCYIGNTVGPIDLKF